MTTKAKVEKARKDIRRVLGRYNLTLPEVMGARSVREDEDQKVWKEIEPTYRRVRGKIFRKMYPALISKSQRKK